MSADRYFDQITGVLARIRSLQGDKIRAAGEAIALSIANDKRAYLFGSGHSVIPVLDVFPRYGSFTGFFPLYDPRLMWFNVIGPGGARELLWLERREGYAEVFLQSYPLEPGDCIVVFSHGGRNAAPIEVALAARKKGLTVITVSSLANAKAGPATHSSGKHLSGAAHIAIDNCVPPEDALVDVGWREKTAAGSTVAAVSIAMALVAETGARLAARGIHPPTFVSPNVPGVKKNHNQKVFEAFTHQLFSRRP
ncbi:MAG: SIS domain-containing protein [Acidobacteria bacterium]|nr:SIS domain-containing protein [Acidobacteriota bacterium]